jgi:hypothetical protein
VDECQPKMAQVELGSGRVEAPAARSTGRRLSLLSNTISTYALITACPAPSCSSRCRSEQEGHSERRSDRR